MSRAAWRRRKTGEDRAVIIAEQVNYFPRPRIRHGQTTDWPNPQVHIDRLRPTAEQLRLLNRRGVGHITDWPFIGRR